MSEPNVEVVRQPFAVKARSRRGVEERVYMRFPSVVAFATRALWRLSPRSRPRRALLLRVAQTGFDALKSWRFRVELHALPPTRRVHNPPSFVALGFDPVYRGREGRSEFQRGWTAEWGEMRFEPEEMLDLGDRVLFVGRVKGSGISSGAGFESDWAVLLTISAGRVIREQPFFDRREALEAAGCRRRAPAPGNVPATSCGPTDPPSEEIRRRLSAARICSWLSVSRTGSCSSHKTKACSHKSRTSMSSTCEQRDREVEHDQLNGKPHGASGAWWEQAWPHTVFVDFEDRDGERFEAEIRVSSVTQAEATEKVRGLLEQLDTRVEPPSGYRPVSTPAKVFSGA
jgi:SnoaL-like domain